MDAGAEVEHSLDRCALHDRRPLAAGAELRRGGSIPWPATRIPFRGRAVSDAVFDADLPDFEFANAFLHGLDMRALATGGDAPFVDQFLGRLLTQDQEGHFDDESDFGVKSFRGQFHAFRKGFAG